MNELTSKQINSLKGLLILIVLADHNDFLRRSVPLIFTGLTFHVIGFFVLYLLALRDKSYTLLSTVKKALNLYKSYLIFLSAGVLLLAVKNSTVPSFDAVLSAIYTGNFFEIKSIAGAGMLWFIPSFVTFMFVALALESRFKLALYLSVSFILCTLCFYEHLLELSIILPAAIIHTCYIASISYLVLFCLNLQNVSSAHWFILFSLVKGYQMIFSVNQEVGSFELSTTTTAGFGLIGIIESVSGVMLVISIVKNLNLKILSYIGIHSLKFYLIHPLVGVGLLVLTNYFFSYRGGLIHFDIMLYMLTLAITWLLVATIVKLDFVKRIIF